MSAVRDSRSSRHCPCVAAPLSSARDPVESRRWRRQSPPPVPRHSASARRHGHLPPPWRVCGRTSAPPRRQWQTVSPVPAHHSASGRAMPDMQCRWHGRRARAAPPVPRTAGSQIRAVPKPDWFHARAAPTPGTQSVQADRRQPSHARIPWAVVHLQRRRQRVAHADCVQGNKRCARCTA